MFCLFPNELDQEGVIENLMLSDYKVPLNLKSFETGTDFLDYCSRLIVKRGIRIYYESKVDNLNLNKLADELINEKKKELQNSAHA